MHLDLVCRLWTTARNFPNIDPFTVFTWARIEALTKACACPWLLINGATFWLCRVCKTFCVPVILCNRTIIMDRLRCCYWWTLSTWLVSKWKETWPTIRKNDASEQREQVRCEKMLFCLLVEQNGRGEELAFSDSIQRSFFYPHIDSSRQETRCKHLTWGTIVVSKLMKQQPANKCVVVY